MKRFFKVILLTFFFSFFSFRLSFSQDSLIFKGQNPPVPSGEPLKEDWKVDSFVVPKGSVVYFGSYFKKEERYFCIYKIYLSKPTIIQGVEYSAGIKTYYERGSVSVVYAHYVEFFENGRVKEGIIEKEQVVNGIKIPANTKIIFDEEGKIIVLEFRDACYFQDVFCKKWSSAGIRPSGNIEYAVLAEDQVFNGIKFKKDKCVWFFDKKEREVKDGIISGDQIINGIKIPDGSKIIFKEPGKLQRIEFKNPTEIQGIRCQYAEFFENGILKEALLSGEQDQKIQNRVFPDSSKVFFYNDGKLRMVWLSKDWYLELNETKIKCLKSNEKLICGFSWSSSAVAFWPSGEIGLLRLAEDTEIQGIKIPAGSDVRFYKSGNLRIVHLSKPTEIQGIKFEKSFDKYFDPPIVGWYTDYLPDQKVDDVVGLGGWQIPCPALISCGYVLPQETEKIPPWFVKCPPYVWFYDDKKIRIKYGVLAEDQVVDGVSLPKDTWIHLDENGHLFNLNK